LNRRQQLSWWLSIELKLLSRHNIVTLHFIVISSGAVIVRAANHSSPVGMTKLEPSEYSAMLT